MTKYLITSHPLFVSSYHKFPMYNFEFSYLFIHKNIIINTVPSLQIAEISIFYFFNQSPITTCLIFIFTKNINSEGKIVKTTLEID